jgi:type IV pili sensor histidine kinase/response regulator
MFIAAACLMMASSQLQASEVLVGRYTLQSTAPTKAQADLLAATVTTRFPVRIQTIGEAVRHLLQNSGYRLASPVALDPETKALFRLPLPAVHRNLGPLTVRRALEILAGPAFRLVQDPIHRLIGFELCKKGWGKQGKPEVTIKKVRVPEDKPATIEGGR